MFIGGLIMLIISLFCFSIRPKWRRNIEADQERLKHFNEEDKNRLLNHEAQIKFLELDKKYQELLTNYNQLLSVNGQIETASANLSQIQEQFNLLLSNFNLLQEQMLKRTEENDQLNDTLVLLHQQINDQNLLIEEKLNCYQELETKTAELNRLIEDQKVLHKESMQRDAEENLVNANQKVLSISPNERRIIELINEIVDLYPILKEDLLGIAWKKVWLPKMQDMVSSLGLMSESVAGIYRLSVVDNENINYVGQATDIKNRWYEHAKKMVGTDKKGTEKLYNYEVKTNGGDEVVHLALPSDFKWEVIEKWDNKNGDGGRSEWLNSREHYWIDYYCCVELGLNKKK